MTNVIGDRISGNLVYRDDVHRYRWIDAIGPDVVKYIDDFVYVPHTSGELDGAWTVTRVEAGGGESTVASVDGSGGIIRITTDAFDNDGINMQLIKESFKLHADNKLYFGIRMKLGEATQNDFFVGLAIADTDILGGVTDSVGFDKVDGSTAIEAYVNKDSTRTEVTPVATANTTAYHILEFFFDGADDTVRFFYDGVETSRLASYANIPDDEDLSVSVHYLTGNAAIETLDIDWIRCIQIGRS
jgi:hypothetical protein